MYYMYNISNPITSNTGSTSIIKIDFVDLIVQDTSHSPALMFGLEHTLRAIFKV
jgi:hypothetical protein